MHTKINLLNFTNYEVNWMNHFIRLIEKECQNECRKLGWSHVAISWVDDQEDFIVIRNENQLRHAVQLNEEHGNTVFLVHVNAQVVDDPAQLIPREISESQSPT